MVCRAGGWPRKPGPGHGRHVTCDVGGRAQWVSREGSHMPMEWPAGKRPVFVGAGWTMIRRYMPRTISSNAKEAATMAIADAGLQVSDIDGIFIWANPNWGSGGPDPRVWLDVNHM